MVDRAGRIGVVDLGQGVARQGRSRVEAAVGTTISPTGDIGALFLDVALFVGQRH
ncbi:hypothetical protein D3C80_2180350 [compost metagenome]